VSGKVDEDHAIVVGDGGQLQAEVVGTGAEAMKEDKRRRVSIVPTPALVVDVRLLRSGVFRSTPSPHE
jgi:hypothetical protein